MPAPSTTIVGAAERIFLCDVFFIRCTIVPETLKSLLVFSGNADGTISYEHNSEHKARLYHRHEPCS